MCAYVRAPPSLEPPAACVRPSAWTSPPALGPRYQRTSAQLPPRCKANALRKGNKRSTRTPNRRVGGGRDPDPPGVGADQVRGSAASADCLRARARSADRQSLAAPRPCSCMLTHSHLAPPHALRASSRTLTLAPDKAAQTMAEGAPSTFLSTSIAGSSHWQCTAHGVGHGAMAHGLPETMPHLPHRSPGAKAGAAAGDRPGRQPNA